MAPVQFEVIFEQDIAALPPMTFHEKLTEGSIFWRQMERIAARLPGADRLVAC